MTPHGINRISPSGLMCYESCPRLFFYQIWLELKIPSPMVHLEFGTAIHAAIDVLYEGRNPDGLWPEGAVGEAIAIKALDTFNSKFKLEHCESPEQFQDMNLDGFNIIKEYWQMKEVLFAKGIDPIQFEIPGKDIMLNPHTKEPLSVPLSYRLDCIAKNHKVVEFKTSSQPYDMFETRARPQSLCYVWAYYQKYGVIPTLDYVVMRKKIKKNKIQHLSFTYDMADLLAFDHKVRGILKQIELREFNPPMKNHNRWCDCRKYEELLAY